MKHLLFGGVWVCVVTLAAVYFAATSAGGAAASADKPPLHGLDYVKTRQISVPRIADGEIQGYVVARFVFTIDAEMKRDLPVPPEVFVVDEAFRAIYGDEKIDFANVQKTDLSFLTTGITEGVNARLQPGLIQETLIEQFNYVPFEAIGQGLPAPARAAAGAAPEKPGAAE